MGAIVAENVNGRVVVVAGGTFADARGVVGSRGTDGGSCCECASAGSQNRWHLYIRLTAGKVYHWARGRLGATHEAGGTPPGFGAPCVQLFISSRPRLHRTTSLRDARVGGPRHAGAGPGGQGCCGFSRFSFRCSSGLGNASFVAERHPRSSPKAVTRSTSKALRRPGRRRPSRLVPPY